jgi:hypothetical protein
LQRWSTLRRATDLSFLARAAIRIIEEVKGVKNLPEDFPAHRRGGEFRERTGARITAVPDEVGSRRSTARTPRAFTAAAHPGLQ